MMKTASRVVPKSGKGEDRVQLTQFSSSTTAAVLADGTGDNGSGAHAADTIVNRLSQSHIDDIGTLFDTIIELDYQLKVEPNAGLSTVVSVHTTGTDFIGAAIGNSDALLIKAGTLENLAPNKEVVPLVGNGEAYPTMFAGSVENAVLILCSDGFSKFSDIEQVVRACLANTDPATLVDALIDSLILPEGQLQDDVAVLAVVG